MFCWVLAGSPGKDFVKNFPSCEYLVGKLFMTHILSDGFYDSHKGRHVNGWACSMRIDAGDWPHTILERYAVLQNKYVSP